MTTIDSLLFLLFCGITAIALLTVINLLLPTKVERVREKLEGHYLRSFVIGLIGLGLSFAFLLLLAYIINTPVFNTMASENVSYTMALHTRLEVVVSLLLILIGLALISISAFGLAALACNLGRQIRSTRPTLNPNLIGAALLVLSGLAPFLGWFIFAPVALCIGFGATVRAFFQRNATPKTVE
jgi:hypothetical protein